MASEEIDPQLLEGFIQLSFAASCAPH